MAAQPGLRLDGSASWEREHWAPALGNAAAASGFSTSCSALTLRHSGVRTRAEMSFMSRHHLVTKASHTCSRHRWSKMGSNRARHTIVGSFSTFPLWQQQIPHPLMASPAGQGSGFTICSVIFYTELWRFSHCSNLFTGPSYQGGATNTYPVSTCTAKPSLGKWHLLWLFADHPTPAKFALWRHKQEN